MNEEILDQTRNVLGNVLKMDQRAKSLTAESPLFGAIPELDSMAVIELIIALEEHFEVFFEDDEVEAEMFDTLGSLVAGLEQKSARPECFKARELLR